MGVSRSYLSRAEVQKLLGVNAFGMWRLVRKYAMFPEPVENPYSPRERPEPQEVWDGAEVYSWAAETAEFTSRGAALLRPLPGSPAPARWLGYRDTLRGPALDWHTSIGVLRIVHCDDSRVATALATAIHASGNEEGVVSVCALYGDMGFHGPALVAADTAQPGIEYEVSWGDIAALAGQVLPWWPRLLRLPHAIRHWEPGAQAAVVSIPLSDQEIILHRAAASGVFDTIASAALRDMANSIHNDRVRETRREIEIFCKGREGEIPNPVIAGAVLDTSRHPLPREGERRVLKTGWRRLALHPHAHAVAALEVALDREPDLLPFGAVIEVPVESGTVSDRWACRLTECRPAAAHAVLAQNDKAEAYFTDPLTGMPVLRTHGADSRHVWRFYTPLSLPGGGAELASVVLHHTLWVTTSDGHVHPAPCTPTEYLWWGDSWGDRASEAAAVVDQILDRLSTTVTLHKHRNAPTGLTRLFSERHQQGTELTRATLLQARKAPRMRGEGKH
ncbi:hypothetical protein [Streptomyces sp. NPDC008121]|uniref:hypothetical protein n=1 Tax=Streptomyces sp. NPDC008121 TaxID=3364809 RepID=UPI0036F00FA8